MCIGLPMQVRTVQPGHALCTDPRDQSCHRIDTALVGPVAPGDWLLTFLGAAREPLDAGRAHEILAVLALLRDAFGPDPAGQALPDTPASPALAALADAPASGSFPTDPFHLSPIPSSPFSLPSRWTAADLARLTGSTPCAEQLP